MYLLFDDRPAEYELGMTGPSPAKPAFVFSVKSANALLELQRVSDKNQHIIDQVNTTKKYFPGFSNFTPIGDNSNWWGFGKNINPKPIENGAEGWTSWEIPLPDFSERKNKNAGQARFMELSANLRLLFAAARLNSEPDGEEGRKQLFEINTLGFYDPDDNAHHNAHSIWAILSPALTDWLRTNFDDSLKYAVQRTMLDCFRFMHGPKESKGMVEKDFPISVEPEKFTIYAYGEAGITLGGGIDEYDSLGFSLTTGNCYAARYQILLLVGLAKIHDLARLHGL